MHWKTFIRDYHFQDDWNYLRSLSEYQVPINTDKTHKSTVTHPVLDQSHTHTHTGLNLTLPQFSSTQPSAIQSNPPSAIQHTPTLENKKKNNAHHNPHSLPPPNPTSPPPSYPPLHYQRPQHRGPLRLPHLPASARPAILRDGVQGDDVRGQAGPDANVLGVFGSVEFVQGGYRGVSCLEGGGEEGSVKMLLFFVFVFVFLFLGEMDLE